MKKIYLSPAIETVELRFTSVLCVSDPGGGGTYDDPNIDPFKPAPRRPF